MPLEIKDDSTNNGNLTLFDLYREGTHILLSVEQNGNEVDVLINSDQSKQIIKHLQEQFKLKP